MTETGQVHDPNLCRYCGAPVEPGARTCPRCGLAHRPPSPSGQSPLLAVGTALLLVSIAAVAAVAFVALATPGTGPSATTALGTLRSSDGVGARPSGSAEGSGSPAPPAATSGSPAGSGVALTVEAARLDGNPWYIEHVVASSTLADVQPGDRTTRVYTIDYSCTSPPCDVTISSDDPDTITPPTDHAFQYRDGAYTVSEAFLERCVTADGRVFREAYRVDLDATIRVVDAEQEGGVLRATALAGRQVRTGTAVGVPKSACPDWRIESETTGSRSVRPGLATDFVSANWAGYVVEPKDGQVSHVRGSWRQPAIDCRGRQNHHSGFWIGIDGFRSETVEQLGTAADCVDGEPSYYAWYEMYPEPMIPWDMAVSPGDELLATIDAAGGAFTMMLENRTTDERETTTQKAPEVERSSAEWIAEPPAICWIEGCALTELSDFGRIRFDDAFAAVDGGQPLALSAPEWTLARHNIGTVDGRRVAETSQLNSDGTSFAVNWRQRR